MTLRTFTREADTFTVIAWLWMMPLLSLPELAAVPASPTTGATVS